MRQRNREKRDSWRPREMVYREKREKERQERQESQRELV